MTSDKSLEYLRPFAKTKQQNDILDTLLETSGSREKAWKKLGIDGGNARKSIRRMKAAAQGKVINHGDNSMQIVDDGFKIKGTSVLYDEAGNLKLQWVKTNIDEQKRYQGILDALTEYCEHLPVIPSIKKPVNTDSDLLSVYTITDFHIGMYAWKEESGEDWDLNIAETTLINAVTDMITGSPDSEEAILNIQGDFTHWDGLDAVTPASKHILDADTRFPKLAMLSLDILTKAIGMLLKKHKQVKVIVCEGNHDIVTSMWLQIALKREYRSNKRVDVDLVHFPFYAHLHGEIMLGFHHGHKVKNKSLPALFSSEPRYRSMWGKAKYTYIHTGHYHHTEQEMSECGGAIVERHPTLSARDAYSARGGYVSWRCARAITYDKIRGEVLRVSVTPRKEN